MTAEALDHLRKRCAVMRRLIRLHGPCTLVPQANRSTFESLVLAVAHQQLNGAVAQRILGRFRALFPGKRFPSAAQLASVTDDALRASGFSWAKIAALRDIARKTLDGTVPSSRAIRALSDADIIERLVQIRGVGRWTAEMMLIFKLGRPDVLPIDDFGVRNGLRIAFGLPEMPKPRDLLTYAERWRPHNTTAAWFLWRAADAAKQKPAIPGITT
ncbi:MAG: DNA-3-methyladenine glycosylase [Chthoniobacter sp.]|jgi:DNA-3-methyladenine glycosylase II|nr:DNA-3-methyladenine glycosylase [Chthoniobacter sp.]